MKLKIIAFLLLLIACKQIQIEEEQTMSVEIRSQLGDVLLSGNPIWAEVAALKPAGATNYKILLRTVSTDSALVGSPFIQEKAPDDDDMAYFNIQCFVDQPATYTFEYPQATKAIAHALLAFDITIEAGESYTDSNGDPQTVWSGTTESHRILKGGLSHDKMHDYLPYRFYDDFINDGGGTKFLTWLPDYSKISLTQPLKLWYIYPYSTSKTLDIHYDVYYKNDAIVNKTETVTLDPDKLYEFNLSPELWNVDAQDNGHDIDYITFDLIDSSDLGYSELRTFYLNTNYYEQNNYIFYKNSIGGVDCLWLTGKKTELHNSERTIATRTDNHSSYGNLNQPTKVVTTVSGHRGWNINTGYKSKAEIQHLRDFALSNQIWLADGEYLVPVYLDDKEKVLYDIDRNLDSLDIKIIEAHTEKYY